MFDSGDAEGCVAAGGGGVDNKSKILHILVGRRMIDCIDRSEQFTEACDVGARTIRGRAGPDQEPSGSTGWATAPASAPAPPPPLKWRLSALARDLVTTILQPLSVGMDLAASIAAGVAAGAPVGAPGVGAGGAPGGGDSLSGRNALSEASGSLSLTLHLVFWSVQRCAALNAVLAAAKSIHSFDDCQTTTTSSSSSSSSSSSGNDTRRIAESAIIDDLNDILEISRERFTWADDDHDYDHDGDMALEVSDRKLRSAVKGGSGISPSSSSSSSATRDPMRDMEEERSSNGPSFNECSTRPGRTAAGTAADGVTRLWSHAGKQLGPTPGSTVGQVAGPTAGQKSAEVESSRWLSAWVGLASDAFLPGSRVLPSLSGTKALR